jgi:hypothetical protein
VSVFREILFDTPGPNSFPADGLRTRVEPFEKLGLSMAQAGPLLPANGRSHLYDLPAAGICHSRRTGSRRRGQPASRFPPAQPTSAPRAGRVADLPIPGGKTYTY